MSAPTDGQQDTGEYTGEVREVFRRFLAGLVPGRPIAVLCHSDADGLAAGAILTRALRRAGHAVAAEATGKGEDAWAPAVAARLARHDPQALLVADLGSRDRPVLEGVPTLLLDHHRPDGVPPGATLVTGYGRDPTPTSGLLAYWAAGAVAEVDDLLWIAAISLLSDLGDDAPFAELEKARQRYKITPLREATALLNAPRRSASGDASPALRLLLEADGPRAIVKGDSPEAAALRAARAESAAAFGEAKRVAPVVVGDVALIRIHTPCQVHPPVARTWRDRLPKSIVMAANTGYLPWQWSSRCTRICSTPFGVIVGFTRSRPARVAWRAGLLNAFRRHRRVHVREFGVQGGPFALLNAFRRHRRVHVAQDAPAEITPTAQRLSASSSGSPDRARKGFSTIGCSTPFGVIVGFTPVFGSPHRAA